MKTWRSISTVVMALTLPWLLGADACDQVTAAAACTGTPAQCGGGEFGQPFSEPTVLGVTTEEKCVLDSDGEWACKPTAGTNTLLPDGRFMYHNALEGTENVELNLTAEFGHVTANDQSRVLELAFDDTPTFSKPSPVDGLGGDGVGDRDPTGGPLVGTGDEGSNGALFCSDVAQLADGRILAAGGTDYYTDPGLDDAGVPIPNSVLFPYGVAEIEGLRNARIFDAADDTWTQTGSMNRGRWYPALVTLPNSDVFVASGVTKLVKPVYPEAPINSGRNVVQTETYDLCSGEWTENGLLAERSLPLYPRMHLLPNGHVYYNAGGQAFNPFGYAYDQTLWNLVSTFDPASGTWTDHAVAGFPMEVSDLGLQSIATQLNSNNPDGIIDLLSGLVGTVVEDPEGFAFAVAGFLTELIGMTDGIDMGDPSVVQAILGGGFRGSTSSVMLPLRPDNQGNYKIARFLTAGGVMSNVVNPSPGSYLATDLSRIDTVFLSPTGVEYFSRVTGSLNQARWYGSALLLPDGQVFMVSGADRDEVDFPGTGFATVVAELFDPATETWTTAATQNRARTYHNTALLMPDGRVLVGGHSPVSTMYGANGTIPGGFSPNEGRDPSFEIYSPPYVFRNDRPSIASTSSDSVEHGGSLSVVTDQPTSIIDSVMLVRRTATTHLVDGDQRQVHLRIRGRGGNTTTVDIPGPNVLPAGHYMLFVTKVTPEGTVVPSESTSIQVNGGECDDGGEIVFNDDGGNDPSV